MRLLILASAASLVFAGAAMARESVHHHHHHSHHLDTNASAPEGAIPADSLSAHEVYIENLRDSGYNPAGDRCRRQHPGKLIPAQQKESRSHDPGFLHSLAGMTGRERHGDVEAATRLDRRLP